MHNLLESGPKIEECRNDQTILERRIQQVEEWSFMFKNRIPRGENYEKNKEAEFRPPSFLQRPKIKREEVLVYVDVNVGPGK